MQQDAEIKPKFSIVKWIPAILFAAALLLRLIGITWGLPNAERHWSYHPDEPVNLLYARQISVGSGDFDPGFYNYGTLYLTVVSIANDVVTAYTPKPEGSGKIPFFELDHNVLLAGRLISAVAGSFTVVVMYLLFRRFFDPLSASLGAIMIAVAPGHTVHSRFLTVDVFAVLWISLSAYAAFGLLKEGIDLKASWRAALLSGVYAGLAAGTKYNGILVLVVLFALLALVRPPKWVGLALGSISASIVAFIASTPGCITNTQKFIEDFSYELNHSRTGHGLVFEAMPPSLILHVVNLAIGVGLIITIVSLLGLGWSIKDKRPEGIAMAIFFGVFYLVLARAEIAFLRYTFPLLVPLSYGIAHFAFAAGKIERGGKMAVAAVMLFLGGIPFGEGFLAAGRYMAPMAGTDARDAVTQFLRKEAKKGSIRVGVVEDPWFYTPPLFPDANAPRFVPAPIRIEAMAQPFQGIQTVQYLPANPAEKMDWDKRLLTELKPDYVVASSFESNDLSRLEEVPILRPEIKIQVDRFIEFKKNLDALYEPAFYAGPPQTTVHDMDYVRPMIWVWKRKAAH